MKQMVKNNLKTIEARFEKAKRELNYLLNMEN